MSYLPVLVSLCVCSLVLAALAIQKANRIAAQSRRLTARYLSALKTVEAYRQRFGSIS